jgi:serine/threonine-protein kinase HipA
MPELAVYADFDWLPVPKPIGTLRSEGRTGKERYSFEFSEAWLREYPGVFLSPDLKPVFGRQCAADKSRLFFFLEDALPDLWGRRIVNRCEDICALSEGRGARELSEFERLLMTDDCTRPGGLRFKDTEDGDYIGAESRTKAPHLSDLELLAEAAREVEISFKNHTLPELRWAARLLRPGAALGGARPKASVIGADGALYIAKFPSVHDDCDAELWEHLYHLLAKKCGIRCCETTVVEAAGGRHTLLSKRFDRIGEKRRHFASAMALLGLRDGAGADDGYGYIDMAEFILQSCRNTEANLEELYRRAAFNILSANSDDHFRNHSFILHRDGWELAPAYDLNPGNRNLQSLLINSLTDDADIGYLLQGAKSWCLSQRTAKRIAEEVREGLSDWKTEARRLGILPREIERKGFRIDERLRSFSTVKTTAAHPSS